jgi:hypothetical protein
MIEPNPVLLKNTQEEIDDIIEESEEDVSSDPSIPEYPEDQKFWDQMRVENTELKNILKTKILDNPRVSNLELLEACRIIASINYVYVQEGLLHRVKRTTPTILESQKKYYEAYEELFKNRDKERLRVRRGYLRKRIEQAKKKVILVHPDIVKSWVAELKRIETHLKKRIKVKVPADEAILIASEETNQRVQQILADIASGLVGGE